MSGCGRKHRAKHLTRQFLDASAWCGLGEGEVLAVCTEAPQGQHVRVIFVEPPLSAGTDAATVEKHNGASPSADKAEEHLVFIPGKFRKVIWLAVRDIVVVADRSTVASKPSPDQLKHFFREQPEWKRLVGAVQDYVERNRREMEQQPQYAKTVHTTTSTLPKVAHPLPSCEGHQSSVEGSSDIGELEHMNPNRNNIRHKVPFFFGEEEEEEEGGEEEGSDEETGIE
ncbi:hypothetical protein, conserved [Trypanosoma brucei gambiense DAL972]|uniref:Uncharacterized protein n=2 Tax=Trypanosoma brucei TaxID=5691 RepID=D0A5X3_TRYB9|nr:hypothetical protein, conserved [Trypanosoma brucei gambiense DAL972]RHW68506.1 hypothetical protein DPX39_110023900 [Trypanosoma brucei equiperdum]CBH17074.1 hypothetical protein, conserved [Trypanosoma brucei gambiense DAL972]|eukprot:XP_011779338.1 hypothetical protein, conserved [Trypanosoma brucei gambiense DAL972]